MIIKPTIGRVVWFYPHGHPAGEQPLCALVAYVWSDTCVNLAVFDSNGRSLEVGKTSIRLLQEGEGPPSAGDYCTWMPYQVKKATAGDQNSESAEPRPGKPENAGV